MKSIKNKTQGEIQFENYCILNQIEIDRIPEGTKREADYKMKIGNHEIFTEIKDFDLTKEGKNNIEKFKNKGFYIGETHKPGKKIRNKIGDAKGQLKKDELNLIVLYDNRPELVAGIYDYEIKVAMYGIETYILNVPDNFAPPKLISKKFGKDPTLQPGINTRISAIGVLANDLLHIYHNKFTTNPLEIELLSEVESIRQYHIEIDENKKFSDWIEIGKANKKESGD
jgi:hypothetical protein